MYKLLDRLTKDLFENVYCEVCGKLEQVGYKCYNVSEEECIDYAIENDIEYEAECDD